MLCNYNFNGMISFKKKKIGNWVLDVIGERIWRTAVLMGEENAWCSFPLILIFLFPSYLNPIFLRHVPGSIGSKQMEFFFLFTACLSNRTGCLLSSLLLCASVSFPCKSFHMFIVHVKLFKLLFLDCFI